MEKIFLLTLSILIAGILPAFGKQCNSKNFCPLPESGYAQECYLPFQYKKFGISKPKSFSLLYIENHCAEKDGKIANQSPLPGEMPAHDIKSFLDWAYKNQIISSATTSGVILAEHSENGLLKQYPKESLIEFLATNIDVGKSCFGDESIGEYCQLAISTLYYDENGLQIILDYQDSADNSFITKEAEENKKFSNYWLFWWERIQNGNSDGKDFYGNMKIKGFISSFQKNNGALILSLELISAELLP
ncbi:MAG: hypothetical protein HYW70_03745 [Candidatus Nealsonbacteria bacterium]|nr:hypothetical protein [Candidatus Nealsonbacteria bacterium]